MSAVAARRPSARAPRALLALADMPARAPVSSVERERALSATLLATERTMRSLGIRRVHAHLTPVDDHAVRLAAERVNAPVVYGSGVDLGEAMADLFRNAARDAERTKGGVA